MKQGDRQPDSKFCLQLCLWLWFDVRVVSVCGCMFMFQHVYLAVMNLNLFALPRTPSLFQIQIQPPTRKISESSMEKAFSTIIQFTTFQHVFFSLATTKATDHHISFWILFINQCRSVYLCMHVRYVHNIIP